MNDRNLITQGDSWRLERGGLGSAEWCGITLIRGSALHHGISHYEMLLPNLLIQSFFSSILLGSEEDLPF